MKAFEREVKDRITSNSNNIGLQKSADEFMDASLRAQYSYNFSWMGRPIIQYPQDIMAMQEIIWKAKPDLIIETGIAHGGSLIFYASMLELNAICGGPENAEVLGIDIDIRSHNRQAIEEHPMFKRIQMIEGSSISQEVIEQVKTKALNKQSVLVCLDSNHTHEHVLAELKAYAPLTTVGNYCVVFDSIVEDSQEELSANRPWTLGNNPKTALREFIKSYPEFDCDQQIDNKLLISVAPEGYLKRLR